ncbi:hypothetical protein EAS61_22875 [Bradyrhizobium zhanjiangense]|uniref:Uncharacterized protein n=1 Tax=Bradyrhizobium zhanjiangense TaxID=1325107 RepID=A0A4Q0QJM5_9BRAD|nr:hypothetical protein EAS61_22875 [Bradyrhizobium zhanjiangense]
MHVLLHWCFDIVPTLPKGKSCKRALARNRSHEHKRAFISVNARPLMGRRVVHEIQVKANFGKM